MDCLDITTNLGLVDALLELGNHPFDFPPRNSLPFIPRRYRQVHDLYTPTRSSTFQTSVPTSAYPRHCPGLWLLRQSSRPSHSVGTCSAYRPPPRAVGRYAEQDRKST